MKSKIIAGLCIVIVAVLAGAIVKKVSPVSWGLWGNYNTSSELALKGYDAVAYFRERKPVLGDAQHTLDWGQATWHFSSAENRELFATSPAAFAPQFGGFCSFAVSKGFTADISPVAWHIADEKLYVFADTNVRDQWVADIENGSLAAATAKWANR